MTSIVLCTGLLLRGDRLLLVSSTYAGETQPLWTLPGGRQEPGESIAQTMVREFWEETGLRVRATSLAYVSESIDSQHALHVTNCTFRVSETDPTREAVPGDPAVGQARFVPAAEVPQLLRADVLRIPVAAALSGADHPRYFAFAASDVRTPFFTAPARAELR